MSCWKHQFATGEVKQVGAGLITWGLGAMGEEEVMAAPGAGPGGSRAGKRPGRKKR